MLGYDDMARFRTKFFNENGSNNSIRIKSSKIFSFQFYSYLKTLIRDERRLLFMYQYLRKLGYLAQFGPFAIS